MKKLHCFFIIYFMTLGICKTQWLPIGPGNLIVFSLAGTGNNVFAGTGGNLYLSTNNGLNWVQTSLNQWTVALAVAGNNIFAGVYANGVYYSSNNGTNWNQTSLNNQWIWSLAINGNNIFAGTYNNGLYRSTNNGLNWAQTSLNNQNVTSITINLSNIFAAAWGGLYLSTNNGQNWNQILSQGVYSLAQNGNYIYAGIYNGVIISTNNGQNWIQTSLNTQASVRSIAVSGYNILVSDTIHVYYSSNSGTNWVQRNEGLENISVYSLYISSNYAYAGTVEHSVYRRPLSEFTGIKQVSSKIPDNFLLIQNYPNPFNPKTKIKFSIPPLSFGEGTGGGVVRLTIYDILGKVVATLINEKLQPGTYEVKWDASDYPSGVYFYKLTSGEYTVTKKLILLK